MLKERFRKFLPVVVDLETGGFDSKKNAILEIAIQLIDEEDSILVAIVQDYYRCTNCGHDTRQYINGKIRYMSLTESDVKFIKEHGKTEI